jgi:TPP-dependent pyruvate/acetoin dehydrogenase alpha subunit
VVTEIVMPNLGATGADVVLNEWLVKPGDFVKAGTPIFVVATDKATVEVETFHDGYVRELRAAAGDTVALGAVVAILVDSMEKPLAPGAAQPAVERPKEPSHEPGLHRAPTGPYGATPGHAAGSPPGLRAAKTEGGDALLELFRCMALIRRFEDLLYRLFLQGQVPGTLHQYQGQEAVAAGVCSALRVDDVIFSTHRPVGHAIAKGTPLRAIAAELWGKADGCAWGKGGQMHLTDVSVGVMPSNAIVGGNIPIATGAALGFKLRGLDRIAVSFFGDGATNIGAFHEGVNLAAVKNAPVIFVCENNQYAASTHISLTTRIHDLADRAQAYGIPGFVVDGMDVLAVRQSALEAVERARRGDGPTLLEYKCYRYMGHSRGDPSQYRSKEEIEEWRQRDPILKFRGLLVSDHGQSEQELDRIEAESQAEVEAAVEFARSSPEPLPEESTQHVFADQEGNR